jgi:hypothetical protein
VIRSNRGLTVDRSCPVQGQAILDASFLVTVHPRDDAIGRRCRMAEPYRKILAAAGRAPLLLRLNITHIHQPTLLLLDISLLLHHLLALTS